MATLRIISKLAAINKENHEKHPRNNQTWTTIFHRHPEDYITPLSEKIEGSPTKKLSEEFSRTESPILGALSELHDFLLNLQARVHSGPVPDTSQNSNGENKETSEHHSQNDSHPELGDSLSQCAQEFNQ